MPEDLAHEQVARPHGRQHDLDDAALLLLDDAGQDGEPEAEDADEDEHRADVGDEESTRVAFGIRLQRHDLGRHLDRAELTRVDAGIDQELLHPQRRDAGRHDLDEPVVLGLVEADLARSRQVGRHVDDDVDLLGGEGSVRAGVIGVGRDLQFDVELRRGRCHRRVEACRSRLDEARPGWDRRR